MVNSANKVIAILLFDGMEELDAVGPWEVFAWWTSHFPEDGYAATTFSADGNEVLCEKTLRIVPHLAAVDLGPVEVVVHPGGDGTFRLAKDPDHLQWLQTRAKLVPIMASVCTGSLVFAAAGLLENRPATSNQSALDDLTAIDPSIIVKPLERFVDDGNIITSAGISAGIDMALHIVGRLAGPQRMEDVRRGIEYNPGRR